MNKKTWDEIVRPVVVLTVISLIVSFALAVTNSYTAPVISENERLATLQAYVDVIPTVSDASELELVDNLTTTGVVGAAKASDGSVAVKAQEAGFDGGVLTVIVGFDSSGKITDLWVDASTQTKGYGSHMADESFTAQFQGLDGTQNITMGENGLDGYSGATYSSKAMFAAVNDCINGYKEIAGTM